MSTPARAQTGDCLVCHSNKDLAIVRENGSLRSLFIDPALYSKSSHAKLGCLRCHTNYRLEPHTKAMVPVPTKFSDTWFLSKVSRENEPAVLACIDCHKKQFREYRESIHGTKVLEGNPDAPSCLDCHGSHYIHPADDLESSVSLSHVPFTCAKCHTQSQMMQKYEIDTATIRTYQESFHGEKLALGSKQVAVCTSCHGSHGIKSTKDPASQISPANRARTCGKQDCHPGADQNFARGFAHRTPSAKVEPLVYWIGIAYKWAITFTIGAMCLYILLDLARRFVIWAEDSR